MLFVDVDGDDGAVVLGRFSDMIKGVGCEMLYVPNKSRQFVGKAPEAVEVMRSISACLISPAQEL